MRSFEGHRASDVAISILLPTYNSETYIEEQITSILEQSFRDFELLVLDDGSSDRTLSLLQKFSRDPRLQIALSAANEGQNRSLIKLARRARGQRVAFADHDDIWHREKLERLHDTLRQSSAGLAFGASHLIDARGHSLDVTLHEQAKLTMRPQDRLRLLFFPLVSGHSALVDRDLLWDGSFAGPMLFDWMISLDAQFTRGIAFDPDAITYHRIHGANQSNSNLKRGTRDVGQLRDLPFPRWLLNSGQEDRTLFFERVDYLANSPIIPPDKQSVFRNVTSLCQDAWFAAPLRCMSSRANCRKILQTDLLDLASNAEDRQFAGETFAALCSSWRRRRSFTICR